MFSEFKQYLSTKGITPKNEEEEQLTFVMDDGLHYLFVCEKSDPNYFRIILPNIFKVESGKEQSYSNWVNMLNKRYKVAKATITDDNFIWISAEQFVYSREGVDSVFTRCFAAISGATKYFKEQQNEANHD